MKQELQGNDRKYVDIPSLISIIEANCKHEIFSHYSEPGDDADSGVINVFAKDNAGWYYVATITCTSEEHNPKFGEHVFFHKNGQEFVTVSSGKVISIEFFRLEERDGRYHVSQQTDIFSYADEEDGWYLARHCQMNDDLTRFYISAYNEKKKSSGVIASFIEGDGDDRRIMRTGATKTKEHEVSGMEPAIHMSANGKFLAFNFYRDGLYQECLIIYEIVDTGLKTIRSFFIEDSNDHGHYPLIITSETRSGTKLVVTLFPRLSGDRMEEMTRCRCLIDQIYDEKAWEVDTIKRPMNGNGKHYYRFVCNHKDQSFTLANLYHTVNK